MRTKTLLLSAAALVAGALSSQAQSNVYSANVVGYATVVYPGNGKFALVANPFDNGSGNSLTNVVDAANTLPKQSQVLTWNGTSFNIVAKGGSPATWGSSPSIPPGIGFFVRNGNPGGGAPDVTNVFVGSIVVANGASVTNQLPVGFSLNGTPIPYAGNIAIAGQAGGDTNMDFGSPLGKQSQILTWNLAGQNYNITAKGGSPPLWGGTVTIQPTDGFFVKQANGPATNMFETLNLQP
jgi:hypothetical protein